MTLHLSGSNGGEGEVHVEPGPGWGLLLSLELSTSEVPGEVEGAWEREGRGLCGVHLALQPILTPCSLQQAFSWGAEPIESELDLIALLMAKPHFSIDLAFCSPQRATSNCSSGGRGGEEGFLHPFHPPEDLSALRLRF